MYTCFDCQQAIPTPYRCTNSGSVTATLHLQIFTLDIPDGNFTAHYDISTKYLGITQDETMAVDILPCQFRICQEAHGQLCTIPTPFQPLANLPSCITALYAKNTASISARCSLWIKKTSDVSMPSQLAPNVWILTTAPSATNTTITIIYPGETTQFIEVRNPIHVLHLLTACSATSPNFNLPPHYESLPLEVNIILDMANLSMINISSIHFCIWQHLEKHQNESQLQHLSSILSVPVVQLYKHMAKGTKYITPFSPEESTADTDSIWILFLHAGIYVMAIGSHIPAGLGILCCYFFWCQPARLACPPLQPGTTQYTIVDDDVEAASIYRCNGKTSQPIRPCVNRGMHMEHIPTLMESQSKQQMQSLVVPAQGSLAKMSKIQGTLKCT